MSDVSKLIAQLSPEHLQLLYERLEPKGAAVSRPRIRPQSREGVNTFPLSYGQQRYWFLQRLEPDNAAYNVPTAVRLTGKLNVPALEQSLNTIVERHEVLRSSFQVVDGQPVQVVAPDLEIKFRRINLDQLPGDEREAEVWRLGAEEAQRIFDLSGDSLLRAVLLRLAEHEHVLLLTTHHIICDKWSHGLFMQELAAAYAAFANGGKPLLPELPVQYADFAVWQREQLEGETLENLLAYWKEQLTGAPPFLDLPADHPRVDGRNYRAARRPLTIDRDLTLKLKALGQREDATLFMILLTVFKILLYRYAEQEKIVTGFLSANRNRSETDGLIGQFANTLVIQAELSAKQSFRELLSAIHEQTLGAYAHQELPFDKLVEELQPERKFGRTPLFQVAFNLQKAPIVDMQLPGLSFSPFEVYRGPANLDLYLEMEEREQELVGAWEYDAELFDADTMDHLMDAYRRLLEQCCEDPEASLDRFELPAALEAKARAARARERKQTIAVAATFTAEPLEDGLRFWMKELGRPAEIRFAPYHQVFQQLLDPASLLGANQYGVNVVLVRMEDWQRYKEADNSASLTEETERNVRELLLALKPAAGRAAVPY
ncbi:MAG TPA: condensation domain-containing protein, partial [Pyrinomonadaceae bacterium]|nr:condensation domain-containing protein [Pyrinomonadaceae bacterium]